MIGWHVLSDVCRVMQEACVYNDMRSISSRAFRLLRPPPGEARTPEPVLLYSPSQSASRLAISKSCVWP